MLLASVAAIVASGFPRKALDLIDVLDSDAKSLPRIQLTAGYAEYMLGNHYKAIGHIRQSLARAENLSRQDQDFLHRLKDASEFRVGIINMDEYQRRTQERVQAQSGLESLESRLEGLYYRWLRERNPDSRAALAAETRETANRILGNAKANAAAKLGARLTFLYVEGTEALQAEIHQKGLLWMRAAAPLGSAQALANVRQQATNRIAEWESSSKAALKEAYEVGHPILISEAHLLVASARGRGNQQHN